MEKKIILENSRTYHSDDIKIAGKELFKSRALLIYIIISLLFASLGGLFIGLSFAFDNDITILVSGILILILAVSIWGIYIYAFIKINKRDYKDTDYNYTFYDDEVVIDTNAKNLDQHMVLKYDELVKGVKCKNYTFLYINKLQALFFLNSDLNEEVYNILKNKVNRFKD